LVYKEQELLVKYKD